MLLALHFLYCARVTRHAPLSTRHAPRATSRHAPRATRHILHQVIRVGMTKLHGINMLEQCFYAQIFVQFRFVDGALDASLAADGSLFPTDEHGTPTFRPSAGWYMDHVDFNNAKEYSKLEAKV